MCPIIDASAFSLDVIPNGNPEEYSLEKMGLGGLHGSLNTIHSSSVYYAGNAEEELAVFKASMDYQGPSFAEPYSSGVPSE